MQIQFGPANPDNPFQEEWRETLRETHAFLGRETNPPPWDLLPRNTVDFVVREIAMHTDISAIDLRQPSTQDHRVCSWRHLALHMCYHKLGKTNGDLVKAFNYAHHCGVSYGLERAEKLLQDPKWRAEYDRVVREVG